MESSSAIRKGRQSDEGDEKSVKFRDDIGSASGRQLDPQAALFSQQFVNSITRRLESRLKEKDMKIDHLRNELDLRDERVKELEKSLQEKIKAEAIFRKTIVELDQDYSRLKEQVQGTFCSLKIKAENLSMQEEATRKYYEQLINECGSMASSNLQQYSNRIAEPLKTQKRLSTQSALSTSHVKLKVPPVYKKKASKNIVRSPSARQSSRSSIKRMPQDSRTSIKKKSTYSSVATNLKAPPSIGKMPSVSRKLKQ